MNPKKLIYGGTAILIGSILLGTIGVVWSVHNSFEALRSNQTGGIGTVLGSVEDAMLIIVLELIGILIGLSLFIFGAVKNSKQKKSQNQNR